MAVVVLLALLIPQIADYLFHMFGRCFLSSSSML